MGKEYWKIALAYVGVIVGAGLSSGQDILQYFLSFGEKGLIGVLVLGILNIIFGRIIVTLGSYYQADSHEQVLSKIAHPIVYRLIDFALVFSSFVMGFVMVAGAGSNLHQQFQLPTWLGSLICSLLIIIVAFMDFDRITSVLGIFTPVIIVIILLVTGYTFIGKSYDFAALSKSAMTIKPAISHLALSVINYYALCAMTGVAMGFVLGGSVVRIGVAQKGGTLGGILIGIIVTAASLTLFANIPFVKDAEMPMLSVVHRIHSALALIYAITIFALVFNTAFSLYYATARRFSKGDTKRMRKILIALTAFGYLCSFGGFKTLIGIMYPVLGYLGIVLLLTLLVGWMKERGNIVYEKYLRRFMIQIALKKHDENATITPKDKKYFKTLSHTSNVDSKEVREAVKQYASDIADQTDNLKQYTNSEIAVDEEYLKKETKKRMHEGE